MFQVPQAVISPVSKAQFHRAAEAMLRMIAADLNVDASRLSIESSAGLTSSMGSVVMETPSLRVEIFMDSFGRNDAPRLMFRDRFDSSKTQHRWIADLTPTDRSSLVIAMRNVARAARPMPHKAPSRTGSAFSRLAAWLA